MQQCSKLHRSHIVNARNMVFEVVPKLSYDSQKEYKREIKQMKMKESIEAQTGKAPTGPDRLLKEKLETLQRRIQQQNQANERWIEHCRGNRVQYGSII